MLSFGALFQEGIIETKSLIIMTRLEKASKTTSWRLRIGERRTLIILGDLLMAVISLGIAIVFWAKGEITDLGLIEFITLRLENWFYALPIVWLILLVDSYDTKRSTDFRKTLSTISISALIGSFIYFSLYFIYAASLPRRGVAMFLFAATLLTLVWRALFISIFTTPRFMHRVLIVGAGITANALLEVVQDLWPPPFFIAGLIDDDPNLVGKEVLGYKILGNSEQLLSVIEKENISDIIVSISGMLLPDTFQTLLEAQQLGIQITRMPTTYEELMGRVPVHYLEADWILRSFVDEARISPFYEMMKRSLDILGGIVGALILIVIGPIISLLIFLEDGQPIIFKQTRAGRGGKNFTIYKFRSMKVGAEKAGTPVLAKENDDRATKVGRFLRKTHLDEWLQFINVLKGEMSLVGPRPERPELVDHYEENVPFYRTRLLAKPGIAGWAQIHVDYFATLEEMVMKLEYDLYYIKHRSIFLDILIILRTFATVIGFRGR